LKRIVFSEEAKAVNQNVPQHIAMNILTAIHRLAESGAGRVKTLHWRLPRPLHRRTPGDPPHPHRQESQGHLPLSAVSVQPAPVGLDRLSTGGVVDAKLPP